MKRRVRKIANFFAFNLLFFALYLNFIHRDNAAAISSDQNNLPKTAAFSGTALVDNPEQYLEKKNEATAAVSTQLPVSTKTSQRGEGTALKLSIN